MYKDLECPECGVCMFYHNGKLVSSYDFVEDKENSDECFDRGNELEGVYCNVYLQLDDNKDNLLISL